MERVLLYSSQRGRGAERSNGSALIETVVALPLLLLITLSTVQWGLIYQAKSSLEYAALMAARAGSVAHADIAAVRDGLARGLLPLYSPPKNAAGALRTMTGRVLPDVERHTRIRILNPTVEAFDDFAEINADGVAEIPNRDLHRRPTDPGPRSGMPIQDANLLKVEVLYGYRLEVPLVGALIARIARHWQRDGDARAMLADRRLPILASAVVRMQSAARENNFMISRDGTTPGRVLAGDGTAGGSGPGSGGPTDPGSGQGGEPQSPPGGWSPVALRTVPYRPSPAPIPAPGQERGPGGAGSGGVPPIVDDPGAGDFPMCQASPHLAAVSPAQPSQQVGNPIHVVTGNKYQREVDLNPLPGELGLHFERHYNSRVQHLRPMGYGWRHSYDATVSAKRDGSVLLHQADGRAIVFQRGYGSPAIPTPTPQAAATAQRVSYPPPAPDSGLRLSALRVEDGELEMLQGRRGYVWHWRGGRTLHFDARGRLRRIQAPGGASTTLSYDPDGRLVQVRDPQLRSLQLFYDRHQRLVRTTDPGGLHTDYGYDAHNNLLSVHYADGTVRKYHYEDPGDPHNLTGITDARGVRFATYRYDEHDRAVLSTHADGADKVALQYEAGRTLVTDAQGQTSTYHTALDNNVPRVTRINGPGCTPCEAADLAYMYNARSQLTAVWDKRGRGKRYSYDFRGRLTRIDELGTNGEQRSLARYYYAGGSHRLASVERPGVDPETPHRVTFRFDGHGRLTKLIESGSRPFMGDSNQVQRYEPITRATSYRYSGGVLAAIDGPREDVTDITRLSYDRLSRLVGVQPPSGPAYRVREYDVYGRPKQVQFGEMMPTLLNYDARGRLIKLQRGDLAVSYRYDPDGRLKALQGSDGIAYQAWYDRAGRLLGLGDASNSQLLLLRDHAGAVRGVSSHDGKGTLLRAVYHQVRPSIEPAGEKAFRLAHLPRALSTPGETLETDAFGMLTAIVHADGGRTEIDATTAGRVAEIINVRGHRTRYHYDDFGNRIATSSPDTGLSVFGYDAAGNRTYTRNANGREIRVEYDALGRPVRQRDNDGTTTYQYAQGRLREIRHPVSPERFQYDAWGRLVDHTRELGGRHFRTRYEYEERSGRLHGQTLPDGQVLRYHYQEKTGALRAITRRDLIGQTTIVGELQHQPFGPVTDFVHGNGLGTRVRYGRNGRLMGLDTEQVQRLTYTYDEHGAITGIRRNGSEEQYDYDNAGRLVSATLGRRHFTYRYDPAGNRLQKTVRSTDLLYNTEYVYLDANNRLQNRKASSQTGYQYDRAGNPLRIGARTYRYNDRNRPIEWRAQGQLRAQYGYNAWGERVSKVVHRNGKRTHSYFLYDRNRLSAEIDGHGRVVAQYIYLGDRPVAKLEGRRIYHIHSDHLGTPRAVTDRDGAVVWAADYDPFGRARVRIQKIDLPLRLPGQYEDPESGTHYNYFRDYDPDTGRYLTPDPIGLAGGPNIFAYADGNPVKWADPWGLYLVAFDGTWNDRAAMLGHESNVALFDVLYLTTVGDTYYVDGVGTDNLLDKFLGGAFGAGGRHRIDEAVESLITHLATSDDRNIDIIGFSRGAAMAREFANRITGMAARNEISQPFRIRFLGLFDTVGSFGIPGNSCDIGYDLSIPRSVEFAAHAIALNEHRPFFPLSSIEPRAGLRGSDATRVEQGFLGAHSDIGGGYADGDLSDVALNWMVEQARRAGVPLGELPMERRQVDNSVLHDERSFLGKLTNTDRDVYYPNDPDWTPPREDLFEEYEDYLKSHRSEAEKTRDHPDYPVLQPFIPQGAESSRIDMELYGEWLEENRGVRMGGWSAGSIRP